MRARLAVALVVALGALIAMAAIVARWRANDESSTARFSLAPTRTAQTPFEAFDEARAAVGGRCLRLLVATSAQQRSQGLREVTQLAPYQGMLFVFPGDSDARFTMANTPTPLDITWFDATGVPVDRAAMTPCPNGTDDTCPTYASRHRYRYALERPAGSAGTGSLGACAA